MAFVFLIRLSKSFVPGQRVPLLENNSSDIQNDRYLVDADGMLFASLVHPTHALSDSYPAGDLANHSMCWISSLGRNLSHPPAESWLSCVQTVHEYQN